MSTKKVVLVVDDMSSLRRQYRSAIEAWGYDVIEANDGMDAYMKLTGSNVEKIVVDAIVSDMRMGNTSGLWLCQAINRAIDFVPPTLLHSSDLDYRGDGIKLKDIAELKEVFKEFVKETHQKKDGGPHDYIKDFLEKHVA